MELKSLFKVSVLSLLIAAPASAALAQDVVTPCSFCGFTLGLGVGATTMMTQADNFSAVADPGLSLNVTAPTLAPIIDLTVFDNVLAVASDAKVYRYGVMGSVFAGYGVVFENHGYLGLELGANFLGAKNTDLPVEAVNANTSFLNLLDVIQVDGSSAKAISSDLKVSRNSVEPFLDAKLGFLSTPTVLVYLRGGINYNKITAKQTTNYLEESELTLSTVPVGPLQPTPAASISTTSALGDYHSKSKSGIGYRAGIGMEYMVTPNFGIGADYIYSWYPRVKWDVSHAIPQNVCVDIVNVIDACGTRDATHMSSVKAKVDDQQVQAQFIYHFA